MVYAATDIPTVFAEVFQRTGKRIDRGRRDPWLVASRCARPLSLLDLTDTWPVRAGASMKLLTDSVRVTQRWSIVFHKIYPTVDGVGYRSSLTGRRCVALYERAEDTLGGGARVELHRAPADATMHRAIVTVADEIGYSLICSFTAATEDRT